jgi:streptomycin 6-kinase
LTLRIPDRLRSLSGSEEGDAWLASLPALVEECAAHWELRLGEPFVDSHVSLVVRATTAGDIPVVLKLPFPDRESEHEADALATWDGSGAVRLLARDDERRAMLLERCRPGTYLSSLDPDDALDVLVGLLPRLWVPVSGGPFRTLAEEAAHWSVQLPARWEAAGRPFERSLVDAALDVFRDLPASAPECVLVHQDLHGKNVLSAEREPWLVIDPKPLAGERAFSLAPVIRSAELGHSAAAVRQRLDRLTDELGVERERARLWTFAQTLAWSMEDGRALPRHLDTVRWLAP